MYSEDNKLNRKVSRGRVLVKFSNLRKTHNDLRIAAMSDPDYQEVLWIRTKFMDANEKLIKELKVNEIYGQ